MRDDEGRARPAVPHEGFLGRIGVGIVAGQSVVLALVAVWGAVTVTTWSATSPVTVLGLGMNGAHALLLGVAAVTGMVAVWSRRWLRRFALAQSVVFFLVFAFGSAYSAHGPDRTGLNLNLADHVLHAVVALLGVVVAMVVSARILEPPHGPASPR